MKVFEDAGLPAGVLNLVFGVPAEISDYLIPVSYTHLTLPTKKIV